MKRQYDFSKAERGKLFRKGAKLQLPIYLDASAQKRLEKIAQVRGSDPGKLVKQLVAKQFRLLRSAR